MNFRIFTNSFYYTIPIYDFLNFSRKLAKFIYRVNSLKIGNSSLLSFLWFSLKNFNLGLAPQGHSSELNLPKTIVPWRDIFDKWTRLKKIFEIFKKDYHHKNADKILHLTFPPLRHRLLFKELQHLLKHRMSPEGTIVPGELKMKILKFLGIQPIHNKIQFNVQLKCTLRVYYKIEYEILKVSKEYCISIFMIVQAWIYQFWLMHKLNDFNNFNFFKTWKRVTWKL